MSDADERPRSAPLNQDTRPVLIVGVGGLGAPAAMALARSGIVHLALIDPDPVELSNLPRQVLFHEADVGTLKVVAAARRLGEIAPAMKVETHACRLEMANAEELIGRAALVIDATDDPATKFLINDVCVRVGTPFVYGGAIMWTGQAMTVIPGRTACLRCIFEEPPGDEEAASCRDAGIIGPVAGAIGVVQATEAARWMNGEQLELAGRMITYDGQTGRIRVTEISARSGCGCGAAATISAATA
jgi:molybdopterin/thiamine biosynthesis adenylyltransferase